MDKIVVAVIGGVVYCAVYFGSLWATVKVVKYAWFN